jgi:coenzyme F420-reducing hydrogenase alpha subunit
MNSEYEVQIALLKETIENMKKTIDEEREEYKTLYRSNKKTNDVSNTSNTSNIIPDDYTTYLDEEYYKENVFINTLKTQITNLIKQNDMLKTKNRLLIEENELLKGEFRI